MCHAGYVPGRESCSFFQWAEFDDDGEPPWAPWAEKVEKKGEGLNVEGQVVKAVIDSGVSAPSS